MGPLQFVVTWYKIHHAGMQAMHWDIHNKKKSNLTAQSHFVLDVPVRSLWPSKVDFVSCDLKRSILWKLCTSAINAMLSGVWYPKLLGSHKRDLVVTSVLEEDPRCLEKGGLSKTPLISSTIFFSKISYRQNFIGFKI